MAMSTQEMLQKADIALSELKSNGGYLDPQQSNEFVRMILDQPTIMKQCRTVTFPGDAKKIEKVGFTSRILRAGVENTALDASDRSKVSTGMLQLVTKEVIAEVRLSYDTIEANIEQAGFKSTIMQLIAERAALDLEELIIQGDTANVGDGYLALMDGLLKQVQGVGGHVLDWDSANIDADMWGQAMLKVPEKYMRVPEQWRFFTDRTTELKWREFIAKRNTAVGDRYLLDNTTAPALGIPVERAAMIPGNLTNDANLNQGQAVLIHPKNVLVGVSRDIMVETDKDITSRQYIIVLTMKLDTKLEEVDASCYLKNIGRTIA